jgi:hypothetical protein
MREQAAARYSEFLMHCSLLRHVTVRYGVPRAAYDAKGESSFRPAEQQIKLRESFYWLP